MGKRTSYEPGTFCWVDLATTDPAGAKAFYGGLFGWKAEDAPVDGGGVYSMLTLDGDPVAAVYEQPEQQREAGVPPNWLSYVTVADAGATAARVAELGGAVHAEPFDVMEAGRMAVIADPAGAVFAVWEPRESIGAHRVNDPGCLTWNELATSDPAAAQSFYGALFDWGFEPIDTGGGPDYWTIGHDGAAEGRNGGMRGMGPEEEGAPPYWLPYFSVESADGAIDTAKGAGANLLAGPIDVPVGKIAALQDPQGAAFAVFEGEVDD